MKFLPFLYPGLMLTFLGCPDAAHGAHKEGAPPSSKSALLSNVQTLTLRKGLRTAHRRVAAVSQLKCIGGSAQGLYDVDLMRCKNEGSEYDKEDIQWTCTAKLPEEFKLGSTDVFCEGYRYPSDPYILKGSCGVEYRLILTEQGEERFGHPGGKKKSWSLNEEDSGLGKTATGLFWVLFVGVLLWMAYTYFRDRTRARQRRTPGRGTGGGGGGGPGGGGRGNYDPPPPYDWRPPRKPSYTASPTRPPTGSDTNEAWRPGFWTGAAAGAAASYATRALGNQNQNNESTPYGTRGRDESTRMPFGMGGAQGPLTSSPRPSSYASSSRHESTGFGSTSRR